MTTPTIKKKSLELDSNPLFCRRIALCSGNDYCRHHVQTSGIIQYRNSLIHFPWLYLPWTIKPLWSPFVDLVKTKRSWIIAMQGFIAAGFAGIAFLFQRHITYNSLLLSFGYWHSVRLRMTSQQTVFICSDSTTRNNLSL